MADAGHDQIVRAQSIVNLNAAQSRDYDGIIVSYSWIQLSGNPNVVLHNADSPILTVEIPDVKMDSKLSFTEDNDKLSDSEHHCKRIEVTKSSLRR